MGSDRTGNIAHAQALSCRTACCRPEGAGWHCAFCDRYRSLASNHGPRERHRPSQREVKALVELRVPFELDRKSIDDVERGANDSDWQPAKDAARQIAF